MRRASSVSMMLEVPGCGTLDGIRKVGTGMSRSAVTRGPLDTCQSISASGASAATTYPVAAESAVFAGMGLSARAPFEVISGLAALPNWVSLPRPGRLISQRDRPTPR